MSDTVSHSRQITEKYVAIGPDGHTIVDTDSAEVLRQAIAKFGSGNFALKRAGHCAFDTWLTVSR